jgi:hypothetical protein
MRREAMVGVRWPGNNSARVFFSLVASEKMSNQSKIDSLGAENEYFSSRASEKSGSEVRSRQSALLDLKTCQKGSTNEVKKRTFFLKGRLCG